MNLQFTLGYTHNMKNPNSHQTIQIDYEIYKSLEWVSLVCTYVNLFPLAHLLHSNEIISYVSVMIESVLKLDLLEQSYCNYCRLGQVRCN